MYKYKNEQMYNCKTVTAPFVPQRGVILGASPQIELFCNLLKSSHALISKSLHLDGSLNINL